MDKPLISVIIPFYKNVGWLEEAVKSVYAQTYNNYEILLINDGSKESIDELLVEFPEIHYFYQENKGAGSARNKGISEAKGKYIAFLDSDDLWLPDKLWEQVRFMENHPGLMWAHCSYRTFGNGEENEIHANTVEGNMFPKCLVSCRIATPCVIINRQVFVDSERLRFNEKMRYGQDFYLWILLCKQYSLGFQESILSQVRMRGSNAAKQAYVMLKAKSELREELLTTEGFEWKKLPAMTRFAYQLCTVGFSIIESINRIIKRKSVIELISKVLYAPPYVLFRIIMKTNV